MDHPDNGNSTKSLVSMRDYVDLLYKEENDDLLALKELLCVKIDALEKATSLAKENMELRLLNMNEWRQQSKDREELFARQAVINTMDGRIDELEISKANLAGRASQSSVYIAYAFSLIGVVLGLIDLLLRLK